MTKLLIVDDSETFRTRLKTELNQNGYDIIDAENGMMGLEMLEQNPDVSLIITDINMPGYDGITMCEKIHEKENINRIPIIALTTQTSTEMKERGKAAGVVAWVLKPYSTESLLKGIDAVLKKFGH